MIKQLWVPRKIKILLSRKWVSPAENKDTIIIYNALKQLKAGHICARFIGWGSFVRKLTANNTIFFQPNAHIYSID